MDPPDGYRRPRRRIGIGAAVVIVVLALGATVGVGIVRAASVPVQTIATSARPGSTDGSAVVVHVSGAVASPGIYRLRAGDRVVDAIAAAGGFAADAARDALNLARPLADGEQLSVPTPTEAPGASGGAAGTGAGSAGARINLNTATVAELDTLPRIGAALAQRIVDWRTANGRFTSVDDLRAVPGIGDKMLQSLRARVTV